MPYHLREGCYSCAGCDVCEASHPLRLLAFAHVSRSSAALTAWPFKASALAASSRI